MTRFQIAVIKDEVIYTSVEFNGSGYWDGYGQDVYTALQKINSVQEWQDFVTEFNNETFGYSEKLHYEHSGCEYETMLNMSTDYYENWCSDYIYIKNLDDECVDVITKYGTVQVDSKEVAVFNFGVKLVPSTDEIETGAEDSYDQDERNVMHDDLLDIAYAIENGMFTGALNNGIEWRLEFNY